MSTKSHPQATRATLLAAGLLAVLAVGSLTVGARAWRRSIKEKQLAVLTQSAPASVSVQRPRPIAQMQSELITISPHGFEPQAITRPPGGFLLMIDNRSGLAITSLELTSEPGARTREMRIPREEPNWSEVIDLQPGRYVLTETDHPRWHCRITVTTQ